MAAEPAGGDSRARSAGPGGPRTAGAPVRGSSTVVFPPLSSEEPPGEGGWRDRLHEIIFEADTPEGRTFDIALLACILLSVLAIMFESVGAIQERYGFWLRVAEWIFTVLFTIEYVLRLLSVKRPLSYATSFFGVVDLLAVIPSYLSLFGIGAQSLMVIRGLRLLRIFRVLKLAHLVGAQRMLHAAIKASIGKIVVFLGSVLVVVLIVAASMYLIEGPEHGFTSIPQSMYWAIVTMTTVGYGDIAPETIPGKLLASVVMILGYGIIAVPTGIVTVELGRFAGPVRTAACQRCTREGHDADATYCKYCGHGLRPNPTDDETRTPPAPPAPTHARPEPDSATAPEISQ